MAALTRPVALAQASRGRLVVCASTAVPKQFKAVKPVGDRVLVKVDREEAKSIGGVLLPASIRNKPTTGNVVALGEAKTVKGGGTREADGEIENHLQISDATVAGFVVEQAKEAGNVDKFKRAGVYTFVAGEMVELCDMHKGNMLVKYTRASLDENRRPISVARKAWLPEAVLTKLSNADSQDDPPPPSSQVGCLVCVAGRL
ncbi:chaperonin, chloroplastic [Tetrabaena socialis]|uniref:Chaperonin, chloroplastic n=1 Tax=Tetrabaena socialis TaxID=47790 RepID=A0A2J8A3T6_9CHLO|nr:chaperonin, chloroplastic [Tetrabaena socialis]|eukprot:PNH07176.1 chaperonin, chloroplastic [Tetrabaena socialis]